MSPSFYPEILLVDKGAQSLRDHNINEAAHKEIVILVAHMTINEYVGISDSLCNLGTSQKLIKQKGFLLIMVIIF
jgi:hypothetical protein